MEDRYTEEELKLLLDNPELHNIINRSTPAGYSTSISRIFSRDPSSYCIKVTYTSEGNVDAMTCSLLGREFDILYVPAAGLTHV